MLAPAEEPPYLGDEDAERRIRRFIRWNAAVRAAQTAQRVATARSSRSWRACSEGPAETSSKSSGASGQDPSREPLAGTDDKVAASTTNVFTRLLRNLLRVPDIGSRPLPIIPDEAATFGIDARAPLPDTSRWTPPSQGRRLHDWPSAATSEPRPSQRSSALASTPGALDPREA
jgi:pyruvate dehydrogenase complex dehydrogenase (E1) component